MNNENEDDSLAFQRGGSEAFRINTSSQIDFHGIGSLVSSTSYVTQLVFMSFDDRNEGVPIENRILFARKLR